MIIIEGIFIGIIATFLFDLFDFITQYAYGTNKKKWNIVGRYFAKLFFELKFFQENIHNEPVVKNENFIGYFFHYFIGSIFGIFFIFINYFYYSYSNIVGVESYFISIFFGFFTVLFGWCFMQPYAYNIGFFASKEENQIEILLQNFISHFMFGNGLSFGLILLK